MKLQLLPSLTSLPCIDLTSSIPINPAHSWEKLCGLRDPNKLTTIVVHHDDIKKSLHADKTAIQYATIIANGHMGIKTDHPEGEPGDPYHIMIRSGRAYQINDLLVFTYGVSGNNGYTVHVCLAGDYWETDTLTQEDYNMLCTVIVSLMNIAEMPNLRIVKGHKEIDQTLCPGLIDLVKLRADVGRLQTQYKADVDPSLNGHRSYIATKQHQYLYNQYLGDPVGQKWLEPHLLALFDAMKERGLFFGSE